MEKKSLIFVIAGSMLLILVFMFIFFKYFNTETVETPKYVAQNMTAYEKIFDENRNSPYHFFNRSLSLSEVVNPTELVLKNNGFEEVLNSEKPLNWNYYGAISLSNKNCFAGNNCMYVNADNTGLGIVMFNSDMYAIEAGKYYSANMIVNCLSCEGEGAYMALIWMGPDTKNANKIRELQRNLLVLENTDGYEEKTIRALAPLKSTHVILGFRVHEETARVTPLTEFYIDGQ